MAQQLLRVCADFLMAGTRCSIFKVLVWMEKGGILCVEQWLSC